MSGTAHFKQPFACTEEGRREFARLVCEGFESAAESLDGRVRGAKWLAFHYATSGTLRAIAAIRVPDEPYREDLFKKAGAAVNPSDYNLELGWVFVVPAHRGSRIAERLCRLLLARVPTSSVFATTRANILTMIRIPSGESIGVAGE